MHDLVIRGARIVDGLGNPVRDGDVAVRDGRIAEIGTVSESARETVEADGRALAPGFVDTHTHYDAQLTWDPTASPSPALGVTTVIMGNCGFAIAPCPPHLRETVAANLSVVEGMDLDALTSGIDWDFESFPEYLDLLRRKGTYPNAAVMCGHSVTRTAVMGKEASERETPTDSEMNRMKALVREAMQAGAAGFASSFSPNHLGADGVPMPSTIASVDELLALCGVMGESGHGTYQMASGARATVEVMKAIAEATGRPSFMTTALTMYNEAAPDKALSILDDLQAARAAGYPVYAQVTCQPFSLDFTPANPYPFYSHDAFSEIKARPKRVMAEAYASQGFRDRFRANLAAPKPGGIFYGNWSRVEVAIPALAKNAGLQNRVITDIAAELGKDPVDTFFDLALEEDLDTTIIGRFLNADPAGVAPILNHESGLVSLSDAGAHLTFMCDAGYGCYFLANWVRERGAFDLAEGVRRLTSLPADLYGIRDRGRILPGTHADLLLFDPANIGISPPRRIDDLPASGTRTVRDPAGVHGVWVNGVKVFDGRDYVAHAKGPGRVLDRFAP